MTPRHRGNLRSSFRYAGAGLRWAVLTQRNMRIHLAISALAVILALLLHFSARDLAVVALTIMIVLALEMLNTVVEAAVDLASPEYHPLAKIAKDVAAGAVLVTAIGAVAVGLLLYVPYLAHAR